MQHLDEGTIHAWLDGALSPEEAARAEAHVGSCSTCAEATAEARGLIAASSRILTALDHVPNVRMSARAQRHRRSFTSWVVREKIAAVVTLVVAGGALALVMARNTPRATLVDLASEPVRTFEMAADSPAPSAVLAEEPPKDVPATRPAASTRVAPASPSRARDIDVGEVDAAPPTSLLRQGPTVVAEAANAQAARTVDSLPSVTVAAAQRAEGRESSPRAASSLSEKAVSDLTRRRAADVPARYAEPRSAAAAVGGASRGAALATGPRLVQEEKMTEEGREVLRRLYQVDGMLVTLDQRPSTGADSAIRARGAHAPRAESTAASSAIQWTDARGTEFTLTGPAPPERLEQIRKLLGL